ncbi:NAD(P)-binding protein [Aspergillus sclerotioniger CBS 115572]|uniref:NAD(P)-binding protein n=1 Tax=Aspergillus sclerotioniger CBS 115572 TaxID=1450535 RepID=A0A317UUC1_9EURO|nr:NAD(P)-binding protein [Aspergillus sclerotioniger CBS 115572]PWY65643.1 NAD(P)-binding protein [Aspergillus sclerotioniger CBS 115572]
MQLLHTTVAREALSCATHQEYQSTHPTVKVTDEEGKIGLLDYAVNERIDNGIHTFLADTNIDIFDNVQTVNARGMFLCCRAQVAAIRTSTRDISHDAILNVCSANSLAGLAGKGPYVNPPSMRLDHFAEGIRCNAVCPTWVRTPLLDSELERNPHVRAEGEEVGDTIVYLLSPSASYINATSLLLDAAVTATLRLH